MGLFDSIAGNLMGSVLGGGQSNGGLGGLLSSVMSGQHHDLSSTLSGVLGSAGGISGLLEKAKEQGLGDVVGSWVGTGQNQPINNEQVTALLGSDTIKDMAAKFGIDVNQALPLVTTMLPAIIDKLTPHGQIADDAHEGDAMHNAIASLTQGGGLTSLLSSFMSSKTA